VWFHTFMSHLPAPLIVVRHHALWLLDSALFDFGLQYSFWLAHGLLFSAFNLGFEDANIPLVLWKVLSSYMCNNHDLFLNLTHIATMQICC